jgi:hypothetical protein
MLQILMSVIQKQMTAMTTMASAPTLLDHLTVLAKTDGQALARNVTVGIS